MILNRLGNKSKLAPILQDFFPEHTLYIEPFFGAGGMFFNKQPRSKFNILNDIDKEVINVFMMAKDYPDQLRQAIQLTPVHSELLKVWSKQHEQSKIWRAVRTLIISNYVYRGNGSTLRLGCRDLKGLLLNKYVELLEVLSATNMTFTSFDYNDFFKSIYLNDREKAKSFIYADPPYICTDNNYNMEVKWTIDDLNNLLDVLIGTGIKFACSEYDRPEIKEAADKHCLHYIYVTKRMAMGINEQVEILITNYELQQTLF